MNRAEELKQRLRRKSHSNPDELLASYIRDHSELKEAMQLANIAEIRASLRLNTYKRNFLAKLQQNLFM